jgi:glycosyltransferase involved in cell wall biosynthesis
MKVLHVLRDLSRNGGVQRLVFDMAMTKDPDLEISVLVTKREAGAEYIDELRANGITVHLLPRWNFLSHYLLYRQFDIVHAHLFPALYLVGFLANKKVYTEHNTNNNRRYVPQSYIAERFIYKRYQSITCITPEVKSSLCDFLRVEDLENARVVYNGVDTEKFKNLNSALRNDGVFNIAMIGSLSAQKDQETIIKALVQLEDNKILHLAGDGERKNELLNLATDLGVADRVIFHGLVHDIPAFLAEMDMYIQSSKYEGFGLAAVEAMSAGLPTLCSDVPGLKELTCSKLNLFPQGDPSALAKKIKYIIKNESARIELLSVGSETCSRFSLKNMNGNFSSIYKGLTE